MHNFGPGASRLSSFAVCPHRSLALVQPRSSRPSSRSPAGCTPSTQENAVRINNDDTTRFGTFPRNQPFDVTVSLITAALPPTAHIVLFGAGASGSADYTRHARDPVTSGRRAGDVLIAGGFPTAANADWFYPQDQTFMA
jgi:hypothetical protein